MAGLLFPVSLDGPRGRVPRGPFPFGFLSCVGGIVLQKNLDRFFKLTHYLAARLGRGNVVFQNVSSI